MSVYTCTNCGREVDTGFLGGRKATYGNYVCAECFDRFNNENSKPITDQTESFLKVKLKLISASREQVQKQASSPLEILGGDQLSQNRYQSQLNKLQGDIQIIQSELQRRATLANKTIIREHVRLYCRYCGSLHDQMDLKCPSCGASTK